MTGQSRTPHYCLVCDDGAVMELGVKDVTIVAEHVTRVVKDIAGWHCPKCGEIEFIDHDSSERAGRALEDAWTEARAGEGRDIRSQRKRLKLTQAEAGQIFGGGSNAFSRYEKGKAHPPKSTTLLLELLTRHPDLLREVRTIA
jgi:HTH-type transcriptional regulator/antitoxin MqsA